MLKDNDIEMYLIHNKGKSVAERFIRTLKTKIYKYMTSISKNLYISKFEDTVNEYNNTYHRTLKMKPVDVKNNTYTDSNKGSLKRSLKRSLWLKKLKNTVPLDI